ncbi:uncharacterized protein MONOS_11174 [Monocercomonoides exilis]|uniref:uncharacterized protein n=1 Tax=Monocercomonoides exilis TaxID=2049356 RepID=UPI00355AC58F|nr:hypothetical protein MONOS_11174 [Monocercomonoides exilis]|eukprot:MONOS_11174.1-p1 / transcript=MONOS_11174.1 / gene=MONOS_11174 / organism=Monocercomonoides_exilis_PA203 / gene_product=unspecified product / transcript_product=unspecified product / location=Mono_scaffold00546:22364-24256(-) / protein_length=630 / sequence_SO=supercontig / SO=protein_coding / is_pseudo=false
MQFLIFSLFIWAHAFDEYLSLDRDFNKIIDESLSNANKNIKLDKGIYHSFGTEISNTKTTIKGTDAKIILSEGSSIESLFNLRNSTINVVSMALDLLKEGLYYIKVDELSSAILDRCLISVPNLPLSPFFVDGGFIHLKNISLDTNMVKDVPSLINCSSKFGSASLTDSALCSLNVRSYHPLFGHSNIDLLILSNCEFSNITDSTPFERKVYSKENQKTIVEGNHFSSSINVLYGTVTMGMLSSKLNSFNNTYFKLTTAIYHETREHRSNAAYASDQFTDCVSKTHGGAIHMLSNNALNVSSCRFENCNASNGAGGAIFAGSDAFGELRIYSSSIKNCHATTYGGGVVINGSVTLSSNNISDCKAKIGGGGLAIYSTISECTLSSNVFSSDSATNNDGCGGGIFVFTLTTDMRVTSVTFSHCESNEKGGAMYFSSNHVSKPIRKLTFMSVVFTDNKAASSSTIGNDLHAEREWSSTFSSSEWTSCVSSSSSPRIYIEGLGSKDDFLAVQKMEAWVIAVIVVGVVLVLLVPIIIIICCCCCGCCIALRKPKASSTYMAAPAPVVGPTQVAVYAAPGYQMGQQPLYQPANTANPYTSYPQSSSAGQSASASYDPMFSSTKLPADVTVGENAK